ncbi:hypothetical protein ACRRTK_000497 [Alexandromys fortis]
MTIKCLFSIIFQKLNYFSGHRIFPDADIEKYFSSMCLFKWMEGNNAPIF